MSEKSESVAGNQDEPLGRAWVSPGRSPRAESSEPLSRERIVAAALDLVDDEGVEALSMRRLAAKLGAGVTSLYWHVDDKEQLLDLVLDEVLGEVLSGSDIPPATSAWRERLEALAWQLRVTLRRHRDVARLYGLRPAVGPNALRIFEYVLATLRRAGLSDTLLPHAYSLFLNHVAGFAQQESTLAASTRTVSTEANGVPAALGSYLAGLPAEHYPNLVAIAPAISASTTDERFAFGIARVLDGLESAIADPEAAGNGISRRW